jgi:hypothetical protein
MAFNMNPTSTQIRAPFNGHLNPNECYQTIFNQVVAQDVRYPDLADNYGLVDMFKIAGGKLGDSHLRYSNDVLSSRFWLGDGEAMNLLALERPEDPFCQALVSNRYRVVKVSLDSYLSKKAWSTENAFSNFTSNIQAMVGETKKLYEATKINAFVGTVYSDAEKSTVEVALSEIPEAENAEAKNRLEAQLIAQEIANLITDMKDYGRGYNSLGYMRAYSEDQLVLIYNAAWVNKITKMDTPTIWHREGLMDKFAQKVLPAKYFGEQIDTNSLPTGLTVSEEADGTYIVIGSNYTGGTVRTMEEGNFTSGHKFPGEALAVGDKIALMSNGNEVYVPAYVEDEDIICKVITKESIKYMSSFETSGAFHNPQSLTDSTILIWGYAEPALMLDQPCVVIHAD